MSDVLRPLLYQRLVQRFGTVRTVHHREPGWVDFRPSSLHDGGFRIEASSWGETYHVCCPFCREVRYRLYIGHLWGYPDTRHNTRHWWMAKCFNQECLAPHDRRMHLAQMLFHEAHFSSARTSDRLNYAIMQQAKPFDPVLPGPVTKLEHLSHDHPARQYLLNRRRPAFDPDWLSRVFDVGYCAEASPAYPLATNRLIIPVYREGKLYGWQARLLRDSRSKQICKYYTMPNMRTSAWLYNFDQACRQTHLVVCEGVSDVWRYGMEATAVFGKKLSTAQIELLSRYCKSIPVVLLLDGSADAEARDAFLRLQKTHDCVLRVQLRSELDPGTIPTPLLRRRVAEAAACHGVSLCPPTSPSTTQPLLSL